MPLIFKEKAETEMYALGIPIETAGRVCHADGIDETAIYVESIA